jgi:hypothetical protein
MLAGGVGVGVAADLGERDIGEGRAGGEHQQHGDGKDGDQARPHDDPFPGGGTWRRTI